MWAARPKSSAALLVVSTVVGALGCEPRVDVYFARPWPTDQVAIAVVTNAAGDHLEAKPRLFEPGAPIRFDVSSPEPFRIAVATFAPDPELERCGACFGGDGDPLPHALGRWRSPLVTDEGELALEVDATPSVLDLHYCCPAELTCSGVTVRPLHVGPTYANLTAVLALSATHVLFGGEAREAPPARAAMYGRIDDDVITEYPPYEGMLDDAVHGFGWDGGHIFYAITPTQLVSLAADGVPTASIATGRDHGTHVAVERDTGRVLFTTDAGDVLTYDVATSTVVPAPGFPRDVENLGVWNSDRIMAIAMNGAIDVRVGARWVREVDPSDAQPTRLAIGDDVMMAMGRTSLVLLRDDATNSWRQLTRPFEPFPLAGAPAGGGRAVIVGDGGSAAMWTGARWCLIDTGTTNRLLAVTVSPDHRRGYIAGGNTGPGTEPTLLAIDLPPP